MSEETPRVWLIGENNPYGPDPRYALYCEPPESAGGRLCYRILGMTERDYLRSFERRNLLAQDRWSIPAARTAAAELALALQPSDRVVLLGRKVFDAWRPRSLKPWAPFEIRDDYFLLLPHPSGLSRAWNDPSAIGRARDAVLRLAPWLADRISKRDNEHRR